MLQALKFDVHHTIVYVTCPITYEQIITNKVINIRLKFMFQIVKCGTRKYSTHSNKMQSQANQTNLKEG